MLEADYLEILVWLCLDINDFAKSRVLILDLVLDFYEELICDDIIIG